MKKYLKKALFIFLLGIGAAVAYGFYLFNKKPADVRKESAAYVFTADSIAAVYNKNETVADKKFLNKVIAVKGDVSRVVLDSATGQATVMLSSGDPMTGITCSFYDSEAGSVRKLQPGEVVTVKGVCTGKLMDIVLNKCSIQ